MPITEYGLTAAALNREFPDTVGSDAVVGAAYIELINEANVRLKP